MTATRQKPKGKPVTLYVATYTPWFSAESASGEVAVHRNPSRQGLFSSARGLRYACFCRKVWAGPRRRRASSLGHSSGRAEKATYLAPRQLGRGGSNVTHYGNLS